MPAPSKITIATSSLLRLLKEESSYHKELEQQQARLEHSEGVDSSADQNAEFKIRQERKAIEETKAIFPPLRERIVAASVVLERCLDGGTEAGSEAEVAKAKDALIQAKEFR